MASYTITTTRQQEVGLKFSYDTYADKAVYLTQEAWFQYNIDHQVSNNMYIQQQTAMSRSFDESFKTIPETEQPAARVEIEGVITTHGGEIVPPGGATNPTSTGQDYLRGAVSPARGTSSNPIQVGGAIKEPDDSSGRNGEGDNETENRERNGDEKDMAG
jgi:hypothetical protein